MVNTADYIEMVITDDMLAAAKDKLAKFHFDSKRGLSKFGSEQGRTLVGYVGERMVMDFLCIKEDSDNYEYDLTCHGKKLEVKSISCKFRPPPHFLCTVNSCDLSGVHKQNADYYVFLRMLNDMSKGWILGFMSCEQFFKKGTFVSRGTTVVKGVDFFKANATVLEINKLMPIRQVTNELA